MKAYFIFEEIGWECGRLKIGREKEMKALTRVAIVIVVAILLLAAASAIIMSLPGSRELLKTYPWLQGFIPHTVMLIGSTLILLIAGRGRLGKFGYRLPRDFKMIKIVAFAFGIGFVGNLLLEVLPAPTESIMPTYPFGQIVLLIWVYASICEEVYARGLIQGLLMPLAPTGLNIFHIRVSLPVIIGATFFALIHLMPFAGVMPAITLAAFLLLALVLGLMAGYQLEKSGSLIPAILVHSMFNVSGWLAEMLT